MKFTYKTQGTCSSHIEVEMEDGVLKDVVFWGGCNGNLKGICKLVKGMKATEVVEKLEGIRCADQLCQALKQVLSETGEVTV